MAFRVDVPPNQTQTQTYTCSLLDRTSSVQTVVRDQNNLISGCPVRSLTVLYLLYPKVFRFTGITNELIFRIQLRNNCLKLLK